MLRIVARESVPELRVRATCGRHPEDSLEPGSQAPRGNGGVIDAGYRGEIVARIENPGETAYEIRKGDKVAPPFEHPFLATEVVESDLSQAVRGSQGFGSRGE